MSDTPETDTVAVKNIYGVMSEVDVDFARKLERERDEERMKIEDVRKALQCIGHEGPILAALRVVEERDKATRERDEAMEQNAKLRDIIKRAINFGEDRAPYLAYPGPTWEKLRAELDQLKEGAK